MGRRDELHVKTFGPVDRRRLEQLERCMAAGDAEHGVLCADHHPGYSQPIGGGIAYEGYVSPSGVGYDIGCGNKAVLTDLRRDDLEALGGVDALMTEITRRISFGIACPRMSGSTIPCWRRSGTRSSHRSASSRSLRHRSSARSARATLREPHGRRGGPRLGRRPLRLAWVRPQDRIGLPPVAQGLAFDARASEGETDSAPVLFEIGSELGGSYIVAMGLAGEYAYAGRDVVVDKVLEILGATAEHEVHNHDNFAWREEHHGRTYWVVRKGCTPARPGQEGFVGGSMGDESVILEGVESSENEDALYSTVHGAGRVMSRSQAAGRVRRRRRFVCRNRDCDRLTDGGPCPEHPDAG